MRYGQVHLKLPAAILVACLALGIPHTIQAEEAALWDALRRGSAYAVMRHALAPGTGDPANFMLGDCTTQRNLSGRGRQQARNIGDRFRNNGILQARVFSSAWCRCQETAKLLALGPVDTLPALNSFFSRPERRDAQTAGLKAWLAEIDTSAPLVLVTHQVNISALTGSFTSSGEIVVMRLEPSGEIKVLGKL